MSTFTTSVPINIRWNGLTIQGAAGATQRIPDAYYEEFLAEVAPNIAGGVTWIDTNEFATIGTPQHSSLLGVTTDQHHAEVHSISGADHTGTLTHAALASVSANQHHNQAHSISGADHTGSLTHAALASIGADDHHARAHDHSAAGDGTALAPASVAATGNVKGATLGVTTASKLIQSGTVSVNMGGAAVGTQAVTFAVAFDNAPVVMLTRRFTSGTSPKVYLFVSIAATTAGFTAAGATGDGTTSANTITGEWVAIDMAKFV